MCNEVVDDGFLRRYRELLDAEDAAFDELEHAVEEGDREHYELDLGTWKETVARRLAFLERHELDRPTRSRAPDRLTQTAAGADSVRVTDAGRSTPSFAATSRCGPTDEEVRRAADRPRWWCSSTQRSRAATSVAARNSSCSGEHDQLRARVVRGDVDVLGECSGRCDRPPTPLTDGSCADSARSAPKDQPDAARRVRSRSRTERTAPQRGADVEPLRRRRRRCPRARTDAPEVEPRRPVIPGRAAKRRGTARR